MSAPKINQLKAFEDGLSEQLSTLVLGINANATAAFRSAFGLTLISVVASLVFAWLAARSILRDLGADPAHLRWLTQEIANDNLDVDFQRGRESDVGVFASLRIMRDKLRHQIHAERAAAAGENGRIKKALDNTSNNIMLVDNALNTQYANRAMERFSSTVVGELRQHVPDLQIETLLPSCLTAFSENAAQERDRVIAASEPSHIDLALGARYVRMSFSPVLNDKGKKTGMVVEWHDRTPQVDTEENIQQIISAARAGDMAQRIDTSTMQGFFQSMSDGVNALLDITERAVGDTGAAISAMARGDLSREIRSDYHGVFGQLKSDVNVTIEKLTEVVSEIRVGTDSLTQRTEDITDGTSRIAERTEKQASNLEETAASMEEMTSTVRQNAENAKRANELAESARGRAEQGGLVVREAVDAMSEITESSNRISAIIGVIDEIAFQTNLLALNAAVEAARAGEQGQGFAVVANEVRNLAGRSANAAKEIKELIKESVDKIQGGSELVGNSGETLEQIVSAVKEVVEIVNEIAAASREQSQGIDQVNQAITQIDEMTQRNAGMVAETASASQSMREQARHLKEMVAFFNAGRSAEPQVAASGHNEKAA
ncbi:MAG TPA: hypothetical protein DD979_10660 [Gammaproteobacteria bacterium]|nr:hypothetical protein [Gammaproteobacteria bacterium]